MSCFPRGAWEAGVCSLSTLSATRSLLLRLQLLPAAVQAFDFFLGLVQRPAALLQPHVVTPAPRVLHCALAGRHLLLGREDAPLHLVPLALLLVRQPPRLLARRLRRLRRGRGRCRLRLAQLALGGGPLRVVGVQPGAAAPV